jgi:hypothetical protein
MIARRREPAAGSVRKTGVNRLFSRTLGDFTAVKKVFSRELAAAGFA